MNAMARVLLLSTGDVALMSRSVTSGLAAAGVTSDNTVVADSSDLPAGVLRAGRLKPLYDAVIVLGTVDRTLESYLNQVSCLRFSG
jgi:hypothetical protein